MSQINVVDLELPQLAEVKKQLDEELGHLTGSFAQLNKALARFHSCIDNIEDMKPDTQGKAVLVPLTNSLYVPGKITDLKTVLVDIGTGYFVRKSRPEAIQHYQQKAQFVKSNLEKLQETIQKKQENVNMVVNLMQARLRQQS